MIKRMNEVNEYVKISTYFIPQDNQKQSVGRNLSIMYFNPDLENKETQSTEVHRINQKGD